MKLLPALLLLTIYPPAFGQAFLAKKEKLTFYPYTYIDTEYRYTDSKGTDVIIQNSQRKGGAYTDPSGKDFFYAIYWYRVINETTTPFELTIHFPADSFATLPSPESYLKVFLPPDTMTLSKETLHAYGATGLVSFLNTGLHQPTRLQQTINPKQAHLFYIGALYHQAYTPARAELVLREKDLFYMIGGIEIPSGKITFKE